MMVAAMAEVTAMGSRVGALGAAREAATVVVAKAAPQAAKAALLASVAARAVARAAAAKEVSWGLVGRMVLGMQVATMVVSEGEADGSARRGETPKRRRHLSGCRR
jgi:hypothetical protein